MECLQMYFMHATATKSFGLRDQGVGWVWRSSSGDRSSRLRSAKTRADPPFNERLVWWGLEVGQSHMTPCIVCHSQPRFATVHAGLVYWIELSSVHNDEPRRTTCSSNMRASHHVLS